jgi:hypothetical protein
LLLLIRDDQLVDTVRVLYTDEPGVLKFIEGTDGALLARAPGEASIHIIPRGYDWDDELVIKVVNL